MKTAHVIHAAGAIGVAIAAAVAGASPAAASVPPMAVAANYSVGEAQNCVIDYHAWVDINPGRRGRATAFVQANDMWGIGHLCTTPVIIGWVNKNGTSGNRTVYLRSTPTGSAPVGIELPTGSGIGTLISFPTPALAPFQGQAPYLTANIP
jgi:hypothetical protein